ncbi:MAG: glycoside hydrolase family 5 protein [Chloroflexi bacterium]|nr:MAG: glycoside hydrolase family 5 protein [Chloroflexota bacterium]
MDKKSLQVGLNLGGWISQYPSYDHQHFKTFLTGSDIQRIADWGMDHVRLPVDYPLLEEDSQPGVYKDSGFEYIESCLEWCGQNGVRLILDLHKAPGFAFDALDQASLFESPAKQERFLALWSAIARRFVGRLDDTLAFELLNEIVLPDSGPWNMLVRKVVQQIRSVSPKRLILIGGNQYNAADELQNIEVLDDPNILYTFHFYLPLTVTHQSAPWIPPIIEYNRQLNYPGQEAGGLEDIVRRYPKDTHRLDREVGIRFDKEYLRAALQPAIDFSERIGQPVYCGEFGVYEGAPMSTRLNWTRDFIELLNQFSIGRAYWTYKDLDFGLVDKDGKVVNQELVEIVSQREG